MNDIYPLLKEYPIWYLHELAAEKTRRYYMNKYYDLLNQSLADGASMGMVGIGNPPKRPAGEYRTEPRNTHTQLRHYEKIAWPERFTPEEIAKRERVKASDNMRRMISGESWG